MAGRISAFISGVENNPRFKPDMTLEEAVALLRAIYAEKKPSHSGELEVSCLWLGTKLSYSGEPISAEVPGNGT